MCIRVVVTTFLAGVVSACAGSNPMLGPDKSAELSFSRQHASGGLPGRFTKLDGKPIPESPAIIRVPAGRHAVEYNCPDVITMDTYPTAQADFMAGESYVLDCDADTVGVVRVRQGNI